jgi:Ca2+-binding RTX toxin-like protein
VVCGPIELARGRLRT